MDISKLGNSEKIIFYSPFWGFSKVTNLGVIRRFIAIWNGSLSTEPGLDRIYNVIVGGIEIGWFTK